jgi:hypothetical protein
LETRKLIAKSASDLAFLCIVDVQEGDGLVTPPAGVTLKAGTYQLFMEEGAPQLGTFTVAEDGTIGEAEPFMPPAFEAAVKRILGAILYQPTQAERLNSKLDMLEAAAEALDGKLVCDHCGEKHSCEDFGHPRSEVLQELEQELEQELDALAKKGTLYILTGLLAAHSEVLDNYGYQDKTEIERQIARIQALLAWRPQPVAAAEQPAPSTEPPPVDDEESGRRNPDTEDSPSV